ncbi:hypothetical protein FJY90_06675 [Candidatus Gottesmanbacteria bacterium]|nr:hypothetical protein [Candidatus Gottesmanbacteria bacterium]
MLSLLSFYLTISIVIFYLELFYQPDRTKNRSSESSNQTQYSNTQKDITSDNKQLEKIFTREELANYNGKNGQPAYVAVDGIVYDLTQVFASGIHYSHFAGQELTDAFYSQHVKSQITKYPAVGRLKSALESRGR